jgi:hypothetical protein
VSRAEHTYQLDDLLVQLIVPDGVTAPRFLDVKRGNDIVRLRHAGVRNLRAPAKRKPRQASPLTKMSEDWEPPVDAVEKIRAEVPSVNVEFESGQFVLWALGKGEARADWVASWRKWLRSTHQWNVERGWKASQVAVRDESRVEKWCRQRGITVEEFERRKDEPGWLEKVKRQGIV